MKTLIMPIVAGAALTLLAGAASATTLEDVKAKGFVQCGVNTGLIGFARRTMPATGTASTSTIAAQSRRRSSTIRKRSSSRRSRQRTASPPCSRARVDVLTRNTTWTMSRDTSLGMTFAGVNYYDGQGFMVRKSLGVDSALQLSGASVCVQSGTTTELNLTDYFKANNMELNPVVFEPLPETEAAYDAGRCDAYTTDASGLYATRLKLSNPDDHIILPEIISKEPLGPVVRQGDDQWFNIVKWVHFALLNAEELGVTQANVEEMKTSENQEIRASSAPTGPSAKASASAMTGLPTPSRPVGNYGEIFERNIGAGSNLQIARGLNALWTKGGIQYAPPIR